MGAGIGIACWPEHAADADTLHQPRRGGDVRRQAPAGSGLLMYDPALDAASAQTLSLLERAAPARSTRASCACTCSPSWRWAPARVVGAEALVRWQHPTRGLVPPMQFIPFAEQTGFIRALTMLGVRGAARMLARRCSADGSVLVLSVNLSTRDLLDQDLPAKLERAARSSTACRPRPSASRSPRARSWTTRSARWRRSKRLRGMGFRLSIDDFGTGYSSLAYLKQPAGRRAEDRQDLRAEHGDATRRRQDRALDHRPGAQPGPDRGGRRRGERQGLGPAARRWAATRRQGYHMGKPMPANDFLAWSARWVERRRMPGAPAATTLLH